MNTYFKNHFRKVTALPPHVVARKVVGKISQKVNNYTLRLRDKKNSTYSKEFPQGDLYSYFPKLDIDHLLPHAEAITGVTKHYFDHRFDLLGSGWVQVKHGMYCRGLEGHRYEVGGAIHADPEGRWLAGRINRANLEESKRVWKLIATGSSKLKAQSSKNWMYAPIDWHLDFKSGYRWSESTWYKNIQYGHKPGVDVKVPWELARMQHLPQLTFAYALSAQSKGDKQEIKFEDQKKRKGQLQAPERYKWEFRNQVLDFIATNPPRFGVNWRCTMDVGIRVANWLVAYDLFKALKAEFDPEFEKVFIRSVYEHGLHIINNLEWSKELRSNHYLADIAGLLFVAAYLPCTVETDAWLAFAVQELIKETELQFCQDGGNFEASTSYHRLSAEMVIYATALVLGLPEDKQKALQSYNHNLHKVEPCLTPAPILLHPLTGTERLSPFPSWFFMRLEKIAEFTMHVTKPNNYIPQIGDNDSGRFLKLQSVYNEMSVAEAKARYINLEGYSGLPDDDVYWYEDHLDHRHLVATINGLFEREDFAKFSGKEWLETFLLKTLSGNIRVPSYRQSCEQTAAELLRVGTEKDRLRINAKLDSLPEGSRNILEIPLPDGDLLEGLKTYAYPNFGLYVFRSKRFYLALRCGPVGQNGNGGHAHNDQLSLELSIDGQDLIRDLGTYLYTPLPGRRNQYRSVIAHFAPQFPDHEPGNLDEGMFYLGDQAKAVCLYFTEEGFIGRHHGYGSSVYRVVRLSEKSLFIIDYTEADTPLKDIYQIGSDRPSTLPFSGGYGQLNA